MSDIYFIQAGSGPIKIGCASYPRRRLKELQCASHEKLKLLATIPGGDRTMEAELHRLLRPHQIRREWFKPVPAVMKVVRAAKKGEPPSDLPDPRRNWLPEGITKARLAKELGVSPQRVQYWYKTNRIPAEYILKVEAATGISRHDLRPDIYPREVEA
jgi:hypothetical protein